MTRKILAFLSVALAVLVVGVPRGHRTPSDLRDAPNDALSALPGDAGSVAVPQPKGVPEIPGLEIFAGDDSMPAAPTQEQLSRMRGHNSNKAAQKGVAAVPSSPVSRPFADYERTGYLIMNSDFNFDSQQAKLAAAQTLGPDGKLVILLAPGMSYAKDSLVQFYSRAVPHERIKFAEVNNADGAFWARDAMPIPVFGPDGAFAAVDAKYYHRFNSDAQVAALFGARLEAVDYFFEGGNFQANDKGDCLLVNKNPHSEIPDDIFRGFYGCKRVIRLPHLAGIGHVDEHARFVNAATVLTDLAEYKQPLEAAGFTVRMLPRPPNTRYASHINSLIIGNKVALPVFNLGTDAEARAAYEAVGLTVVPANTHYLSERGQGSIHCITMTYPPVPFKEVLKSLRAREI